MAKDPSKATSDRARKHKHKKTPPTAAAVAAGVVPTAKTSDKTGDTASPKTPVVETSPPEAVDHGNATPVTETLTTTFDKAVDDAAVDKPAPHSPQGDACSYEVLFGSGADDQRADVLTKPFPFGVEFTALRRVVQGWWFPVHSNTH